MSKTHLSRSTPLTELKLKRRPIEVVPIPVKKNRCEQCAYWDTEIKLDGPPGRGLCRGDVAQLVFLNGQMQALWPITDRNEWCGRFKEKEIP